MMKQMVKATVLRGTCALLAVSAAGCTWVSPEVERRRFDCNGLEVTVSTKQRVLTALGGEEYVNATVVTPAGVSVTSRIDINGRWADRMGASVAADASWVRFYVEDSRGAAAGRYRYTNIAFVEAATGTMVRSALAYSTDEERAKWFMSSESLMPGQIIRGRDVTWQPCDNR